MPDEKIELPADGSSLWAGMGDWVLVSPDGRHEIALRYEGEPPHGDSFHRAAVDGVGLPGLVWGCNFAASADSRYLAAGWMAQRYERKTLVVDLERRRFVVLPVYIHDFRFEGLTLAGAGSDSGVCFDLDGAGPWTPF